VARAFIRIVGAVLTLAGIAGFFLPFEGLLNLNTTHNVVHLVSGIGLLALSGSEKGSVLGAKLLGLGYLALALLGLFTRDAFGFFSLTPADTIIHFVAAGAGLYAGFKGGSSS
jgi:hypothetical protein